MAEKCDITPIGSGKTKYSAIQAELNGVSVPLSITAGEMKVIMARGLKMAGDMPELTEAEATSLGYINARSLGLIPDYDTSVEWWKWTDCATILQDYLNSLRAGSLARIFWPAGIYFFSIEPTVPVEIGIDFAGVGTMPYINSRAVTSFYFDRNKSGIIIPGGCLAPAMRDIRLVSLGTEEGKQTSGIYHNTICNFSNVSADGFGFGFYTDAGMPNGNSSLSFYGSCRATNNKFDGFYAHGNDANSITYLNCVSVQNWRNGFTDDSYLGNNYIGCQTATNGRRGSEEIQPVYGRPFSVVQDGASTVIIAPYVENDQAQSYIAPNNRVANAAGGEQGDWCGNDFGRPYVKPGGSIHGGDKMNRLTVDDLTVNAVNLGDIQLKNAGGYGQPARTGLYAWDVPIIEAAAAGATVSGRSLPVPFTAITGPTLRNGLWDPIDGMPGMPGIAFKVGDKIRTTPYSPDLPEHYRIITAGRWNDYPKDKFKIAYKSGAGVDEWHIELSNPAAYADVLIGDALKFDDGNTGTVTRKIERYTVEVDKPRDTDVQPGNQVDFFNGWIGKMQPVGYNEKTLLLNYAPYTGKHKTGDTVRINGSTATVISVKDERGVLMLELGIPDGQGAGVYDDNNQVGWQGVPIYPVARSGKDATRTITLAFPTASLQPDARVWVAMEPVRVARVEQPGIVVRVTGNIYNANSFIIPEPTVKAY